MISALDDRAGSCRRCGREMPGVSGEDGLCPECAIVSAQEHIPTREDRVPRESGTEARTRRSAVLVAVLSIILVAVGLWLLPPIMRQPVVEPPPRVGTLETDVVGDECIENLDILLVHLQETGEFDEDFTCPASGAPYVLEREGGPETISRVMCPTPGSHELTALYVEPQGSLPTAEDGGEVQ